MARRRNRDEKARPRPQIGRQARDLATLRAVHVTLARIVTLHGEAYLPLFERIDAELARREDERRLLERARQVAAGASATR